MSLQTREEKTRKKSPYKRAPFKSKQTHDAQIYYRYVYGHWEMLRNLMLTLFLPPNAATEVLISCCCCAGYTMSVTRYMTQCRAIIIVSSSRFICYPIAVCVSILFGVIVIVDAVGKPKVGGDVESPLRQCVNCQRERGPNPFKI